MLRSSNPAHLARTEQSADRSAVAHAFRRDLVVQRVASTAHHAGPNVITVLPPHDHNREGLALISVCASWMTTRDC
jgi:hypothetical protein